MAKCARSFFLEVIEQKDETLVWINKIFCKKIISWFCDVSISFCKIKQTFSLKYLHKIFHTISSIGLQKKKRWSMLFEWFWWGSILRQSCWTNKKEVSEFLVYMTSLGRRRRKNHIETAFCYLPKQERRTPSADLSHNARSQKIAQRKKNHQLDSKWHKRSASVSSSMFCNVPLVLLYHPHPGFSMVHNTPTPQI